jgi:hypothetical protein
MHLSCGIYLDWSLCPVLFGALDFYAPGAMQRCRPPILSRAVSDATSGESGVAIRCEIHRVAATITNKFE